MHDLFRPVLADIFAAVLGVEYTKIPGVDVDFFFRIDDAELLILFEETSTRIDWRHNFQFFRKPYREMTDRWYAHRGFLKCWKAVEPYLAEAIKNPAVQHITVAGYSHGAALALLCHEYCKFNRPELGDSIVGFGFGCPRVVWGPLPPAVRSRFEGFTVVRNVGDIVTHVPPALFGFRHVGEMLKVGRRGKYGPFKAHFPESYLSELEVLK